MEKEMGNYLVPDSELEQISGGTDYSNGGRLAVVLFDMVNVRNRFGELFGNEFCPGYERGDVNIYLNAGDIVTVLCEETDRYRIDLTNIPGGKGGYGYVHIDFLQYLD